MARRLPGANSLPSAWVVFWWWFLVWWVWRCFGGFWWVWRFGGFFQNFFLFSRRARGGGGGRLFFFLLCASGRARGAETSKEQANQKHKNSRLTADLGRLLDVHPLAVVHQQELVRARVAGDGQHVHRARAVDGHARGGLLAACCLFLIFLVVCRFCSSDFVVAGEGTRVSSGRTRKRTKTAERERDGQLCSLRRPAQTRHAKESGAVSIAASPPQTRQPTHR